MAAILDELAAYAKIRVKKDRESVPLEEMRQQAFDLPKGNFCFERALSAPGPGLICEVKKASPSKGIIDPVFDYLDIAGEYEKAGATCISCLTEPKWFLGNDEIFCQIRKKTALPMIRKDFTVDEYQIYQAKVMGADAVLLICALLSTDTVRDYLGICDQLGITALVEAHDEAEIRSAVDAGARVIGVNNRNLKDFSIDLGNTPALRKSIPPDCLFVAESGVKKPEDAAALYRAGADAVLIGEALMRAPDKKAMVEQIREACGV